MADFKTVINISRDLERVVEVANGMVKYKQGENDMTVARRHGVKDGTVQNIRKKIFGRLMGSGHGHPGGPVAVRLESLEARVTRLEAEAGG